MINVNLLHVPEPGCQPQGVFQITGIQSQNTNLSTYHPHWNDQNVKILQDVERISTNLQYCDIRTAGPSSRAV